VRQEQEAPLAQRAAEESRRMQAQPERSAGRADSSRPGDLAAVPAAPEAAPPAITSAPAEPRPAAPTPAPANSESSPARAAAEQAPAPAQKSAGARALFRTKEAQEAAKLEESAAGEVRQRAPAAKPASPPGLSLPDRAADAPPAVAGNADSTRLGPARTAEAWLRDIERLRREGRDQEARRELEAFRLQYPQHPLPPSLQ
jgi:hypothetical protein